MTAIFDLFGDPIPEGWGKRGRPQHIATRENRNKVTMLLAFGWNNERIARALSITPPTLRKNYFRELRDRELQRDRLDAALAMRLWGEVEGGNIAAIKEFRKLIERNDLMGYGQTQPLREEAKARDEAKAPKLGKKEQALLEAREPDPGTTLGELMALRQGRDPSALN